MNLLLQLHYSTGNYNLPFIPMAILLAVGAGFWLVVDPAQQLSPVLSLSGIPIEATGEAQF